MGAIFIPSNKVNPIHGMEQIIRGIVHGTLSGVESYPVARNGSTCIGVKQVYLEYDGNNHVPATTIRKLPIKTAINEFIGYLRGYTNIEQFRSIGVKTWDQNAADEKWKTSRYNRGEGDIGVVYGAYARNLRGPDGEVRDQLKHVIDKLRKREYDRRLIVNWYDPFIPSCIPACMYEHTFTVHAGKLNLSSIQRKICAFIA